MRTGPSSSVVNVGPSSRAASRTARPRSATSGSRPRRRTSQRSSSQRSGRRPGPSVGAPGPRSILPASRGRIRPWTKQPRRMEPIGFDEYVDLLRERLFDYEAIHGMSQMPHFDELMSDYDGVVSDAWPAQAWEE